MLQVRSWQVNLRNLDRMLSFGLLFLRLRYFSMEELLLFILPVLCLCHKSIAESKHCGDFHPECLLLLKRPLREPLTRCWGRGSRPLSLFCSLCRLCSLYADRLARSAFHLLFASSCHKLTVDVHTWPASGRSMARIDGRSTGKGMVLTGCQSTL